MPQALTPPTCLMLLLSSATLFLAGCTRAYKCADPQIQPTLIGFNATDIDTVVLRKFKPNDNYQSLLDSIVVTRGRDWAYQVSHDTTALYAIDDQQAIKTGYDWKIFIPATRKTIALSTISSESKTVDCGWGLFSMDKFGCACANTIFSVKQDNQTVSFSSQFYQIFIRK